MAKKKILIVYGCEVSYFVHIIHIKQYIVIKVAGKIIPPPTTTQIVYIALHVLVTLFLDLK